MADRRRRRHSSHSDSEYSEDESKEGEEKPKRAVRASECESESGARTSNLDESTVSEYESAEEEESETESETEEETETEYEGSVIVEGEEWIEERQSGDGEEQPTEGGEGNLDDDEDRKNPAYIPRKGAFYEHDTRISEQEAEDQRPKKKLWKDMERWEHDRYQSDEQAPKSREELIALYGYDIRAGDKPPDAPPRGRGRGGGGGGYRGRRERQQLGDFIKDDRQDNYNDDAPPYQRRYDGGDRDGYRPYDNRNRYDAEKDRYHREDNDGYRGRGYGRGRGRGRGSRGSGPRSYSDLREGSRNDSPDSQQTHITTTITAAPAKQWPTPQENLPPSGLAEYPPLKSDKAPHASRRDVIDTRTFDQDAPHTAQPPGETSQKNQPSELKGAPMEKETKSLYNSSLKKELSPEPNGDGPIIKIVGHAALNTPYERKAHQRERRGKYGKGRGGAEVPYIEKGMRNLGVGEDQEIIGHKTIVASPTPRMSGPPTFTSPSQAVRGRPPGPYPGDARGPAPRVPAGNSRHPRPFQGPPPQQQQQQQQQQKDKDAGAQGRPKRYSSQRQRNMPDAQYQDLPPEKGMPSSGGSTPPTTAPHMMPPGGNNMHPKMQIGPRSQGQQFYPPPPGGMYPSGNQSRPARPAIYNPDQPPPPRSLASYPQPPLIPGPPPAYTIPGSAPPRIFPSAETLPCGVPASIPPPSVAQPAILRPAAYITTAPPPAILPRFVAAPPPSVPPPTGPPAHFQVAGHVPIQAFPPPPVPPQVQEPVVHVSSAAPFFNSEIPVQQVEPPAQTGSSDAVHVKGGTTYFNPSMQFVSVSRSPVRRPKSAIPIVNPEDIEDMYGDEEDERIYFDAYGHEVLPEAEDDSLAPQQWAEADHEASVASKSTLNSDAPPFISPNLVMADPDSVPTEPVVSETTECAAIKTVVEPGILDTSLTSEATECSSVSDMSFDHAPGEQDPRDGDTPTPTPEEPATSSSPQPPEQVCGGSTSQPPEQEVCSGSTLQPQPQPPEQEVCSGSTSQPQPPEQVCSGSTLPPPEESCAAHPQVEEVQEEVVEVVSEEQPRDIDSSNVSQGSDVDDVKDKEDSQNT